MTPAAVQAIYVAVPLAMALASVVGTALGRRIGRVQAVLALRATGLSSFGAMLYLFDKSAPTVVVVALSWAATEKLYASIVLGLYTGMCCGRRP